jgi:hypothetical protein
MSPVTFGRDVHKQDKRRFPLRWGIPTPGRQTGSLWPTGQLRARGLRFSAEVLRSWKPLPQRSWWVPMIWTFEHPPVCSLVKRFIQFCFGVFHLTGVAPSCCGGWVALLLPKELVISFGVNHRSLAERSLLPRDCLASQPRVVWIRVCLDCVLTACFGICLLNLFESVIACVINLHYRERYRWYGGPID